MNQISLIKIQSYHIIIILIIIMIMILIVSIYKKYKKYENFSIESTLLNIKNVSSEQKNLVEFNELYTKNINPVNFRGIIVAWSGSIDTIPIGWALCDGTNNTPDLRSRFIVGASSPSINSASNITPKYVNDISGSEKVSLNENNLPKHSHSLDWSLMGCTGGNCGQVKSADVGFVFTADTKDNHTDYRYTIPNTFIPNTDIYGYNTPIHENMPPYYTLAYIMKI